MEGSSLLMTKVGGFPLVTVVGVGAGSLALLLALRSRATPKNPGSGVDMLSPSTAEAFGTLQQQNEDVSNALSALGMQGQDILTGNTAIQQQVGGNANALQQVLAGVQYANFTQLPSLGAPPGQANIYAPGYTGPQAGTQGYADLLHSLGYYGTHSLALPAPTP